MEKQSDSTNGKKIGVGIALVALIAIAAVVFGAKKSATIADTTTDTSGTTVTTPTTRVPHETTNPGATNPSSTSAYKDGTYTATGSYMSPGGPDKLGVSLTIKNGIVTDATVTPEPGDRESQYYQGIFVASYKPLVVGKDISTIKLSKVSGSSLTSGGFDDALAQIKAQAKA